MKARDLSYRIFNQFYYENMQNGTAGASVAADAKLMTTDHSILIEYSNRLSHIMNSMRNVERTAYVREMETAKELMKMIEEEYHFEK
jgi:hypothetical protein